jgi:hypothetical protein
MAELKKKSKKGGDGDSSQSPSSPKVKKSQKSWSSLQDWSLAEQTNLSSSMDGNSSSTDSISSSPTTGESSSSQHDDVSQDMTDQKSDIQMDSDNIDLKTIASTPQTDIGAVDSLDPKTIADAIPSSHNSSSDQFSSGLSWSSTQVVDPFAQVSPLSTDSQHKPVNIDTIIHQTIDSYIPNTTSWFDQWLVSPNAPSTSLPWASTPASSSSQTQTVDHHNLNQEIGQITNPKHHSIIWLMFAIIGFLSLLWWWFLVYKMMFNNTDTDIQYSSWSLSIDDESDFINAQFVSWEETLSTGIIPVVNENIVDSGFLQDNDVGDSDSQLKDPLIDRVNDTLEQGKTMLGVEESVDSTAQITDALSTQNNPALSQKNYLDEFNVLLSQAESWYQYADLKDSTKATKLYKLIINSINSIISKLKDGEVIEKEVLDSDLNKYTKYLQRAQKLSQS